MKGHNSYQYQDMQRATTALPNIQGVPKHLVNFSGLWKSPKNDSVASLRNLQDVWEHPVCIHINCLLQLPTILKLLIMYSYNIIQCIIVKFYQKYFHVQCTVTMFEINIIVSTKSSLKAF